MFNKVLVDTYNYLKKNSLLARSILGAGDIITSAIGYQKISIDITSYSSQFTYAISSRDSKELKYDGILDYIEQQVFLNSTSYKGQLRLTSGVVENERFQTRSLRHIRQQANKGYLYSTSLSIPFPNRRGIRKFGSFIPCNGVWIEIEGDGTSYNVTLVTRNHWLDERTDISNLIPLNIDIGKGNYYDIQMTGRGFGDIKVFINLKLVYHRRQLGTLDNIAIENTSLPCSLECINLGDEVAIIQASVGVSMEGGDDAQRHYGSVSNSTTLVDVTRNNVGGEVIGTAILCFRLPKKIPYGEKVDPKTGLPDVNGTNEVCYSRDIVMDSIKSFCKDESFTVISVSRGVNLSNISEIPTNIDPLIGWTRANDSFLEFMRGGDGSILDNAFQIDYNSMIEIHASRHEIDKDSLLSNPNPMVAPFYVTSDSYVLVSLLPDGVNKSGGCNIEFSEQI